MRCLRCKGIMMNDKFYGPNDCFWGWKCTTCGEIIDEVILENRELIRRGWEPNIRNRKMRKLIPIQP